MSTLHAATGQEALRALDWMLGWDRRGWVELQIWRPGREKTVWAPAGAGVLPGLVRELDERYSDQVLLGVPRVRRWGGVTASTVLWARVEGDRQAGQLERFRPEPTLVLGEGTTSRQVAFWLLEAPLRRLGGDDWLLRANKRLAHRLGTAKKWADPDRFVFPAPGTCLREGRARPVPVVVRRLEPVSFAARDVVGGLRDAPDPDAWRERVDRRR